MIIRISTAAQAEMDPEIEEVGCISPAIVTNISHHSLSNESLGRDSSHLSSNQQSNNEEGIYT